MKKKSASFVADGESGKTEFIAMNRAARRQLKIPKKDQVVMIEPKRGQWKLGEGYRKPLSKSEKKREAYFDNVLKKAN